MHRFALQNALAGARLPNVVNHDFGRGSDHDIPELHPRSVVAAHSLRLRVPGNQHVLCGRPSLSPLRKVAAHRSPLPTTLSRKIGSSQWVGDVLVHPRKCREVSRCSADECCFGELGRRREKARSFPRRENMPPQSVFMSGQRPICHPTTIHRSLHRMNYKTGERRMERRVYNGVGGG